MTKYLEFDCGCKFPIINEQIKSDGFPSIRIDYENLNYNCSGTWELFSKGLTKGTFQLESNLGQSWAKKVRPFTIEQLGALTAILRPGCLKGMLDGKSIAQRYADRNTGEEECEPFHEAVKDILSDTHSLMIYQEQVMGIAQVLGGFDLKEAMGLLKGIGKKKADIVAKYRQLFVDGCVKVGTVSDKDAVLIFDIIEKSARYLFNKSHAISYGVTAYQCANVKYHFPHAFFVSCLSLSGQKLKPKEEIAELVREAKQFNIIVENPNISYKNENFIIDNGKIRYGLGSIKSVGVENVKGLLAAIESAEQKLNKSVSDFGWYETLLFVLSNCRKDVTANLIHAGALSQYGMTRQAMLFEYNKFNLLNPPEIEWIQINATHNSLINDIGEMLIGKKIGKPRREKIENILYSIKNPPTTLEDSIEVVASCEEDVLGISLSCSKLDAKNLGYITCTCSEFQSGEKTQKVIVAMEIGRVTEWSPKDSDKKICFLTGYDKTGKIEVMVPSREYEKYSYLIFNKNTISVQGSINNKSTLTAKVITQL